MNQIHKRIFIRNDEKKLYLYGYKEHKESPSQELEITEIPKPHMRWNPSREDWVTYSAGRKNRTSFPPKEYCPLCPGANLNPQNPYAESKIKTENFLFENKDDYKFIICLLYTSDAADES